MNNLQKKFFDDNIDFIEAVCETGEVDGKEDLAEVVFRIYGRPAEEKKRITEKVHIKYGKLVQHDEDGPYILTHSIKEVKKIFKKAKEDWKKT